MRASHLFSHKQQKRGIRGWIEQSVDFACLPFHPWGVEVSGRPQCSPYQAWGHNQCHFIWQCSCSVLDVVVGCMMGSSLALEQLHPCRGRYRSGLCVFRQKNSWPDFYFFILGEGKRCTRKFMCYKKLISISARSFFRGKKWIWIDILGYHYTLLSIFFRCFPVNGLQRLLWSPVWSYFFSKMLQVLICKIYLCFKVL